MSDPDQAALQKQVARMKDELAGASGVFSGLAKHFRDEGRDDWADDYFERANRMARLAGIKEWDK